MDNAQLLLGSLLVLFVCLIIWLNNLWNGVKQSAVLKYVVGLTIVSCIYFYSQLDKTQMDNIWKVSGGSGDDVGLESLIVELPDIPM